MLFRRLLAITLIALSLTACGSAQPAEAAQKAQSISFLLSQVRASGVALAGGKVYFYAAGTTTLKTVWLDRNKTTAAANPYTLDANGTAQLYGDGVYRVVIKDSAGATKYDRDNLSFRDISNLAFNVADYASFAAAVASIGNTPATLEYSTDQTLTANISIPANVELVPVNGAKIIHSTYTVSYAGNVARWGKQQIFSGTGAVTLSGTDMIYPEWRGAGASATAATNTTMIQWAMDTKKTVMLTARYHISDELTLRHGTLVDGLNPKVDKRAVSKVVGQSALIQDTVGKSVFVTDQSDRLLTYVWGVKISDIELLGQSTSGTSGLYLKSVAQSTFDNVSIYDFDYGIRVSYGMLNTYSDCTIIGSSATTACVYIDEFTGTTTTQTFNDCYLRGAQWAYINKSDTNIYTANTIFNGGTWESTAVGGAYIGKSCSATCVNLNAENVPADTITTNGSVFSLGLAGWAGNLSNGYLKIIGGNIAGGNGYLYTDSAIFRVGTFWSILADGATVLRATQLLDLEPGYSFPIGGLAINALVTVALSDPATIDNQIVNNNRITGSWLENGTGTLRNKVVKFDQSGANSKTAGYIKVTGTGTKIVIPITSQSDLNVKHIVRFRGVDGTNNAADPKPFYGEFAVGSLTTLTDLTSWAKSANITSIAITDMTIVITLNYTMVNPQLAIEIMSENAPLFDFSTITVAP